MSQTHIATRPTWVICFNQDRTRHHIIPMVEGNHLLTGLDTLNLYFDEADADEAYREFDPLWKVGPFDVNTATAEDFDSLPSVGPAIAEAIVENQPHWESVEALTSINGVTAEMAASWTEPNYHSGESAVVWDWTTYQEPVPEPELP